MGEHDKYPDQILQISHVTLNCEMPEVITDKLFEDSNYIKDVYKRINTGILDENSKGKVNAKKLNSRIFWFEPRVLKFEEFK